MICFLTIVRYPAGRGFAGFLSMALFRLPLILCRHVSFYKLLGCGKNGSFDIHPDWHQWALLTVHLTQINTDTRMLFEQQTPLFIQRWWKFWNCEQFTIVLEPIEGHGTWDHQHCFGPLPKQTDYTGKICILTRATIRLSRLQHFWKAVDTVANTMAGVDGFISSVGIGEVPFIKQATFSIWEDRNAMKSFAYKMKEHQAVIQKTHRENWYSEEMFVRFKPLNSWGSVNGLDISKRNK